MKHKWPRPAVPMKFKWPRSAVLLLLGALLLLVTVLIILQGCSSKPRNEAAEAPPKTTVEHVHDGNVVQVAHPEQFPLFTATARQATSTLNVTGTVNPDISRTIPVISLASGRVLATFARLGDYVRKGQLLMEVQSNDIAGAFNQYLKAVNDERLTKVQLDRAKILYDKGAIPKSQLEIAQNAEDDAAADLTASEDQLHVLGLDKNHPAAAAKIYAPASGYIITQNATDAGAAGMTYAGSSTSFTIADLSHVWVICDVYENDLPMVHVGQTADIRLNAYPDRVFTGRISEIDAVLDPTIRTAKVRIQVDNPHGLMRVGMFVTATFHGKNTEMHAAVPASAVLHLHDRDWIYTPAPDKSFQRVSVLAGNMLPGDMQEINSGIAPGQQVVSNALELQDTVDQ